MKNLGKGCSSTLVGVLVGLVLVAGLVEIGAVVRLACRIEGSEVRDTAVPETALQLRAELLKN